MNFDEYLKSLGPNAVVVDGAGNVSVDTGNQGVVRPTGLEYLKSIYHRQGAIPGQYGTTLGGGAVTITYPSVSSESNVDEVVTEALASALETALAATQTAIADLASGNLYGHAISQLRASEGDIQFALSLYYKPEAK